LTIPIVAILILIFATAAVVAEVTPSSIDISLAPGEVVEADVDVDTDGIPQKIDVVFGIDDTGNMGNEIAAIKAGATEFMSNLQLVADAHFGVVRFDDLAFRTFIPHPLSGDAASVQTALNLIVASGGGDCPEFAISGIAEALNGISWRQNSERIIFVVTDAGVKDANIPADNLSDTIDGLVIQSTTVNTLAYISGCNFDDSIC